MDGASRGEWFQQHSTSSAVLGYPFTFGVTWEKDAPILVRCKGIKLDMWWYREITNIFSDVHK
jgi:hypothetical protein